METKVMASLRSQVLRKMRHLIFVSFLPYMLSVQYAAALTLNEAVPDELHTVDYRWFAGDNSINAPASDQPADEKKLVWSFHAGYMLTVGMSNRVDPGRLLQKIFFEHGPQIFIERGRVPRIALRIEQQF